MLVVTPQGVQAVSATAVTMGHGQRLVRWNSRPTKTKRFLGSFAVVRLLRKVELCEAKQKLSELGERARQESRLTSRAAASWPRSSFPSSTNRTCAGSSRA